MSFYQNDDQPSYDDLMDMLAAQYAQQGGGFMGADPYAPSGGFPSPPMPNGKMPQYRTQGSGYVSDGTVRDYAGMAMADQDRFSTDAFLDVDPALKPLIARAVAEAGQDPYAAYANFDDPSYRQALTQMAIEQIGYQNGGGSTFDPAKLNGMDADGDGQVDEGKTWSIEDLIADQGGMTGQTKVGSGFIDPLSGREFDKVDTYANALRQKMGAYEGALDNFFTQAAPSTERNLNDIESVTGALGGMPFPSRGGSDSMDYSQSGAGFSGPQKPARDPGIRQDGSYSKHQYMHDYTLAMQGDQRAQMLGQVLQQLQHKRQQPSGGSRPTRSKRRDMPARGGHESARYVGGRPVRS